MAKKVQDLKYSHVNSKWVIDAIEVTEEDPAINGELAESPWTRRRMEWVTYRVCEPHSEATEQKELQFKVRFVLNIRPFCWTNSVQHQIVNQGKTKDGFVFWILFPWTSVKPAIGKQL